MILKTTSFFIFLSSEVVMFLLFEPPEVVKMNCSICNDAFYSHLKSKVGNILPKVTVLRINLEEVCRMKYFVFFSVSTKVCLPEDLQQLVLKSHGIYPRRRVLHDASLVNSPYTFRKG